jgi:hypothetical protein
MRVENRFDRIALVTAAMLVGAALVEGFWPHELVVVARLTAGDDTASALAEPAAAPYPARSVLEELAQRPLFTVDRRPYEAPPAAASTAPAAQPSPTIDAELVGVVKAADAQLILVRLRTAPTVHRLRIGGELEGWTVTSIGEATATLSSDGREQELSLAASTSH